MGTMTPAPPKLDWRTLPNAPATGTVVEALSNLEDGSVTMVSLESATKNGAPFGLLLLRSASTVRAFLNRCSHFGVPLAARQAHLRFTPHVNITCNVHYAKFRWNDGTCESGECAGEGLIPIPVVIDNAGNIRIAEDSTTP
jgi:nitrite reductase/ring-hydroxylating ferredoxin subunit